MVKKDYTLSVVTKFEVGGIAKTNHHKELDRYGVSIAVSDSLIYFVDTSDSLIVKSCCYNFNGQRKEYFTFPTENIYGCPFIEDGLFYLNNSRALAYYGFNTRQIGVYDFRGSLLYFKNLNEKNKNPRSQILGVAEANNALYYISLEASFTNNKNYFKLYRESNGQVSVIDSVLFVEKRLDLWNMKEIQIDNYTSEVFGILKTTHDAFLVNIFDVDAESQFLIKRNSKRVPPKVTDIPAQFNIGKNFIVIGFWSSKLQFPRIYKIYNNKGVFIGQLKFKDDRKNELIDIVGDKLIAFNPSKSAVTIYRITVK